MHTFARPLSVYRSALLGGLFLALALLPGVASAVTWVTAYDTPAHDVRAMTIDTTHHVLYAGTGSDVGSGTQGQLYSCSLSLDCTNAANWVLAYASPAQFIDSLTFDSAHGILYAGTGEDTSGWPMGTIYRCDTAIGCIGAANAAHWTVAYGPVAQGKIYQLFFDAANAVLYASAGDSAGGAIYRCRTATWPDQCASAGDWSQVFSGSSRIFDITKDTINDTLYASGGDNPGRIYRCAGVAINHCDTQAQWTISFTYSTSDGQMFVDPLTFDFIHGVLYAGTYPHGIVFRCDTSTGCNNTSNNNSTPGQWTVSYASPEQDIDPIAFDPNNGILYAGTASNGIIYYCNTSSGCQNGTGWAVSYPHSTENDIYSIIFDASAPGTLYAGTSPNGLILRGAPQAAVDQPDLVTANLTGSGTFTVGSTLTFTGNVANQGAGAAPASTARFCIDNSSCLTSSTGQLSAPSVGALDTSATSTLLSATWVATAGTHTVYLCADVGSTVIEGNEANNCSNSGTFTVGSLPPTVITNAATALTTTTGTLNGNANPNNFAATGWFRYSTTNPGSCNDTFGTRVPASGGTALGSGGAGVNYTNAISGLTSGTTYYYCAIASNANGTSFGAVVSFVTTAQPDLMISLAPSLNTGTLVGGNSVTFKGTIMNGGSVAASSAFTNRFQVDINNDGTIDVTLSPDPSLPSLAAAGTAVVTSGTWSNIPAGTHRVILCADNTNVIAESNEANNCSPAGSGLITVAPPPTPTGTLTIPTSCTILAGASTCQVSASWTTANATGAYLWDGNTSTVLYTANSSAGSPVWVAEPSTVFVLKNGDGTQLATQTVTGVCASGSSWNGSICAAAIPVLSVSPAQKLFGDVPISTTSSFNFTVTNTGASGSFLKGAVTSSDPHFTCTAGCDYSATGIAQGSTWTTTIQFAPGSTVGSFAGNITFTGTNTSPASSFVAPVSGNGIVPVSGAGLNFGNVVITKTKDLVLTITNSGGTALSDILVMPSPVYTCVGGCAVSIPAGGSQNITIHFAPTAVQTYNGTASLQTNSSVTFPFTGAGVQGTFKFIEQ